MISRDDLMRLRWPIAFALAMAGVGAAAVFGSNRMVIAQQSANAQAQAKRQEIRAKLSRARQEESEIKSRIGRFEELMSRGVIGEERRLEWVERLKSIKAQRRLYDLEYELSPQRPLDASVAPGSSAGFEFAASTMRLQMRLLHEGDLLGLLRDLEGGLSAFVRPNRCTIERLSPAASASSGAQLKADCSLDWITIRPHRTGD
jgi:hypothetical protein